MDDAELVRRFEDHSLDLERWTHEAHLRVTYHYVRRLLPDRALGAMRDGIRAFNEANGIEQTETSGYHETVTHAWFRLVSEAARQVPEGTDSLSFLAKNPCLLEKKLLLEHYRRETIMSARARESFVDADLEPLPVSE